MFRNNILPIYILSNFNITLLKTKISYMLYGYSDIYIFKLGYIFKNYDIFFDRQTQTIMRFFKTYTQGRGTVFKMLLKLWRQNYILTYVKIKYTGKGYKMYLKKFNRIFLQFGFSHKVYVADNNTLFSFLSKGKLMFLGYNKKTLYDFLFKLIRLRYVNIFTVRGIRLSRQVIFKKVGKVSAYI